MKIGDILILTNIAGWSDQLYTVGKSYKIYRIDNSIKPDKLCGWIKNDIGDKVYFYEEDAAIDGWKYLKDIRKEKLEKIKNEL